MPVIRGLVIGLVLLSLAPAQEETRSAGEERSAAEGLKEARQLVEQGQLRKAWDVIARLREGPLAKTRTAAANGEELARLRLVAGLGVAGGAAGLRGVVELLKDDELRLLYDFEKDPTSIDDFEDVLTLPDVRHVTRKGCVVSGTGAFCHRAVFSGDLRIQVAGAPMAEHDFGLVIEDPDARDCRFLAGVLNNGFFGTKYGRDRQISAGHLLIFCGRGAESRARQNPSQILARSSTPDVARGNDVQLSLSWRKQAVQLAIGSVSLTAGLTAPAQVMERRRAGLHLHRSAFRIDRVVIEGRLDPAWSHDEAERLRATLAR